MKKNIILLVVDALNYKKINNRNMPFLCSLMEKSIYATNMYSQAPYTEAALMALIGGQNTLKNKGYIKRLSNCYTLLDAYADNGFKVFANCYQPGIYPSGAIKGATDKYYNICFDFKGCWNYRLKYYLNLYNENKLCKDDFVIITEILEDNLNEWERFFDSLKNNKKNIEMLYELIDTTDIDINIKILENELKKFRKDKMKYIVELFENPEANPLFTIKLYDIDKIAKNKEFIMRQINKRKKLYKKIFFKNFLYNFRNTHISWKNIWNFISLKEYKNIIELYKSYFNCIYDKDLMKRNELIGYAKMKYAPSMLTQLEHFKKWSSKNSDPYLAYLHFDDIHYPEFFFSYDSLDEKLLDEQFENIEHFINTLPKNFKGNLAYELGLLYTDDCIKRFFNSLEKSGMLENTDVIFTSDHGNSYGFTPLRESYVNNFYDETYHVPFIWYSKNNKKKEIKSLCSSVDIPTTIVDINKIKKPNNFDGENILKKSRNYVYLEYLGSGCPDIKRRDLLLGVRNDRYKVIIKVGLDKKFCEHKKLFVFDLQEDKMEHNNLKCVKKINEKIKIELDLLEKRFDEIKKENE